MSHVHVQLRGKLTTLASRWPRGLCSTIMAGATMDLVYVLETLFKVAAQFGVERSWRMAESDSARRTVAEALYSRHEVIEL